MSTAQEIADQSMELSGKFMDSSRDRLLEMSGRDIDLLREAADLVREYATRGPARGLSTEHLAFTLITAAHRVLVDGSRIRPGEAPSSSP